MPVLSTGGAIVVQMCGSRFEGRAHEEGPLLLSAAWASTSFICLPRIFALTCSKVRLVYAGQKAQRAHVAHVHGGPLDAEFFALLVLFERLLKKPTGLEHGREVECNLAVFRRE